jgi:hypothetical protein
MQKLPQNNRYKYLKRKIGIYIYCPPETLTYFYYNDITLMKRLLFILLLLPLYGNGQIITSIAGGGSSLGDGGPATAALVTDPVGCAFNSGEFYIACLVGNRIRKINHAGVISTVAGTGIGDYMGDGGPATAAKIKMPEDITFDSVGNLFFTDAGNHAIRRIDLVTGIITTICGTGSSGYSGDFGPASAAMLNNPHGIVFDKRGNLFFSDASNHRIRRIDTAGIITTVAGTGIYGFSGDGLSATTAQLYFPTGIVIDTFGNIYVADNFNNRIRKINTLGIITTIAGNGVGSYIGDEIPATAAQFSPGYIKFDSVGNLFISDEGNRRVYEITTDDTFRLVAGNGTMTNGGDNGLATAAGIYKPSGIALDSCGNLYISNVNYDRIRKVTFDTSCHVLGSPLGEQNVVLKKGIDLYPNPTRNHLHIVNATTNTTYHLYNMVGAVMLQGVLQANENTISLHSLPPGMYMLQLTDEAGERTAHKIVKE